MFKNFHGVPVFDKSSQLVLGICSTELSSYHIVCLKISSVLENFILRHITSNPEHTCKILHEEGDTLDNDFDNYAKKKLRRHSSIPSLTSKFKRWSSFGSRGDKGDKGDKGGRDGSGSSSSSSSKKQLQ